MSGSELCEMYKEHFANISKTTSDDVRPVVVELQPRRRRQDRLDLCVLVELDDNLAHVLALRDQSEGGLDVVDRKHVERVHWLEGSRLKQSQRLIEDLVEDLGPLVGNDVEIDRGKGHVPIKGRHRDVALLLDVRLAQLDVVSERGHRLPRGSQHLSRSRIEDHIHAPTTSEPQKPALEVARARTGRQYVAFGDVVGVAEEPLLLLAADGHVDCGAEMPRQLDCSLSHTARARVDEHCLSCLETRHVDQTVVHSGEDDLD